LGNVDIEFGIDVQGLGCAQLVFQDADTGIKRKLGKENASCGHSLAL
jgi:hypothetical protein